MMHQPVHLPEILSGRPKRDTVIQKDEIISLKIDLQVLSTDKFLAKYFGTRPSTPLLAHSGRNYGYGRRAGR